MPPGLQMRRGVLGFLNIVRAFTGGYMYNPLPLKGLWRVEFGVRRFRELNITARGIIVRLSLISLTTYAATEAHSSLSTPRARPQHRRLGLAPENGCR